MHVLYISTLITQSHILNNEFTVDIFEQVSLRDHKEHLHLINFTISNNKPLQFHKENNKGIC